MPISVNMANIVGSYIFIWTVLIISIAAVSTVMCGLTSDGFMCTVSVASVGLGMTSFGLIAVLLIIAQKIKTRRTAQQYSS